MPRKELTIIVNSFFKILFVKILVYLLYISACCAGLLTALFFFSKKPGDKSNGFSRKFLPHIVSDYKVFDLGINSWYISGFGSSNVYLGNYTVPDRLLRISKNFKDSAVLNIKINRHDTLWGGVVSVVDSPGTYLLQTVHPTLRHTTFNELKSTSFVLKSNNILSLKPLSTWSVFGKKYEAENNQTVLFKETDTGISTNKFILQKNKEGIFLSDGWFAYQPRTPYFFYGYYYQNSFLCFDTSMNKLYESKTIDTFSNPLIDIASSRNNTVMSFSSRPHYVNNSGFISDSLLFIHSAVMGNNEDAKAFRESMVIDVYGIASGKYLFSFYLPLYKGNKCTSIQAHGQHIYAIYDRYLISVKHNLFLFKGNFSGTESGL